MQPIQDWTPVSWNKNNERKTAAEKKLELKQALRNGTAITTAKCMHLDTEEEERVGFPPCPLMMNCFFICS